MGDDVVLGGPFVPAAAVFFFFFFLTNRESQGQGERERLAEKSNGSDSGIRQFSKGVLVIFYASFFFIFHFFLFGAPF